jgi:thiol-disulfide isomerase/thioredoxin
MGKRKVLVIFSGFFVLSLLITGVALAQPKVGDNVGNLKFNTPLTEEGAKYLGLAKAAPFTLKDIKADYVLVDVFSTLCPHCIQQAPHLNNLYNLVNQDAKLKGKLKLLAVGHQDNEMKLKAWKAIQKVPLPLIPDEKGQIFSVMNLPGTPVSMVVDKNGKVHWVHIGAFESADTALKEIKEALKL